MSFSLKTHKPPLWHIFSFIFLIPTLYYLLIILSQNQYICIFQFLLFLTPALILIRFYRLNLPQDKKDFKQKLLFTLVVALLSTFILNNLLDLWVAIFPLPKELVEAITNLMSTHPRYGIYLDLFGIAVVPAICEEFFFRGFLQGALKSYLSQRLAIFAAAFFFAFYHLNPWFFPFYLALGFLFGWLYEKTNNIWMAVFAHFINNAYGVILFHTMGKI